MANEMIERVAMAIFAVAGSSIESLNIEMGVGAKAREFAIDECREAARAAIEAMRKATDAMIKNAYDVCGYENGQNWSESLKNHYEAMIDAALSENG